MMSIGQEVKKLMQENVAKLRNFRVFKNLRSHLLDKIYKQMQKVKYKHGQHVYRQGEQIQLGGVYFVLEGEFEVERKAVTELTSVPQDMKFLEKVSAAQSGTPESSAERLK